MPTESPTYSFCESSGAGSLAPWHIRKLTEAGKKLSGGIDTGSLCGRVAENARLEAAIAESAALVKCLVRKVVSS